MADLIGKDIGRYHIIEQLGQGGMATVFRAYDKRLEREVAIKFIRREEVGAAYLEQMLKRFEREAKSLAQLSHPNIVKVYDYGDYEGVPYLVMEYLPGGTLKQRLGQRMAPADAARLLTPIARALAYAHQEHIIHRDVKPANILITRSVEPMLTDFGIAKILESATGSTALTGTGVGMGTPDYMAPEQWTNQVTPQTDVYALGVVYFEMVTGRRPFTADTPAAVLIKQMQDPLPRPKLLVPDLPDAAEQVLFKALAKTPAERYPTMAAFADALEGLMRLGGAALPRGTEGTRPAGVTLGAERSPATALKPGARDASAPQSTGTAHKPLAGGPPPTELMSPVNYPSGPQRPAQPPPAANRGPWLWVLGGGGLVLGLLAVLGVVVLAVVFVMANSGRLAGGPTPPAITPPSVLTPGIAVAAAPPMTAAPAATAAPGSTEAPAAAAMPAIQAPTAAPVATAAPAAAPVATEAPVATQAPAPTQAPPASIVTLRFCDKPCSQAGAQLLTTFPATTQIYFAVDFAGMTPGATWSRAWSNQNQPWVTYQGCHWKAAAGTMESKLWDNGGLRAGVWTITVVTQDQTFTGSVTVGGNSTFWSPVGTVACKD